MASRFGYWKDTGIRLEGEAVWSMTVMFLEMWNYINQSSEDYKQVMPQVYQKEPFEGDGFVQPYGDTPLDHETVGENIYLNIINHAERYVYIFTPYLIIDNEMLVSLCNAEKRLSLIPISVMLLHWLHYLKYRRLMDLMQILQQRDIFISIISLHTL